MKIEKKKIRKRDNNNYYIYKKIFIINKLM